MNQLCSVGLLCGIFIILPISQVQSQIATEINAGSSLYSDNLKSQIAHQNHPWWVNLGAGPALVGNTFAMNGGMVYCYQFDRSIMSARMLGVTNNNPTVQKIDQSYTIYKMADYGILYGPIWQTDYGYASVGAGLGLVRAAYETQTDITTNTSISVPVEAQWFWRFTTYAGLGVYTYASLNFEKQFYGVMVCAQLGAW
jgi:hypothetical protein